MAIALYLSITPKPYPLSILRLLSQFGRKFQLVREFGRNFSYTQRQIFI
jgi:hypothetical protein